MAASESPSSQVKGIVRVFVCPQRVEMTATEACPPLYPSLERLLTPDSVARVTGLPVDRAHISRTEIAGGLSGARIERLIVEPATEGGGVAAAPQVASSAYILKHLDPATNWLMRASGDRDCREIQLTQSR